MDLEQINQKEAQKIIKNLGVITPEKAAEILLNIKRKLIRRRRLLYWGERSRVKAFANDSDLVKAGWIPSAISFSKQFGDYLRQAQESAKYLLPVMIALLKVAWAFVSKRDYNLLWNFRRVCEELVVIDIEHLSLHRDTILVSLTGLERHTLLCHYRKEYPQIINSSIQLVFQKFPEWAAKLKNIDNHLANLLDISQRRRSLIHLIQAVNLVVYGRLLDVLSLTTAQNGEVVNTFNHEGDLEITAKIEDYRNKQLSRLDELTRTRGQIGTIRQYIDRFLQKGEDGYDRRNLIEFYKDAGTPRLNFTADSGNISLFASNLVNRFVRSLWGIFLDGLELEGVGRVKLFDSTLFDNHFVAIRGLSDRIEKAFFTKHNFPYDHFVELHTKAESEVNGVEKEIITVIDSLSHEIMTMGKKLAAVSLAHSEEGSPGEWKPLGEEDLKRAVIPCPLWNFIILQEGYFKGWKAGSMVDFLVSVCFLTGLFFYDREFAVMLGKEKMVDGKVDEVLAMLERICDPLEYETVKRGYQR